MLPNPDCVVKVGAGRGFIVIHHVKVPPLPRPNNLTSKLRLEYRLVITAAHCLPQFPRLGLGCLDNLAATYKGLLGSLDGKKQGISAECLFVDPVGDVAILTTPDRQSSEELYDQAAAYDELTEDAPFLRIGQARSGKGWMLSLDRCWIPTTLRVFSTIAGTALETDPTEPGMSGSPILNHSGEAVGLVSSGHSVGGKEERSIQPILACNLPGRMLQLARWTRRP